MATAPENAPTRAKPRKRPRQARAQATVEAILEAAAHILRDQGYEKASTNRIAERAGVSIGSLYQYFPNKRAIVCELIDQHVQGMLELLIEKLADLAQAPLEQACLETVRAMVSAKQLDPQLHQVFIEQVPRIGMAERVHEISERMGDQVRSFVLLRQEEIRPEVLAHLDEAVFVIVQAVEGITHRTVSHPREMTESLAEQTAAMLFRYMAKPELTGAR